MSSALVIFFPPTLRQCSPVPGGADGEAVEHVAPEAPAVGARHVVGPAEDAGLELGEADRTFMILGDPIGLLRTMTVARGRRCPNETKAQNQQTQHPISFVMANFFLFSFNSCG